MQRCPSCSRHAKLAEASCPWCGGALRSIAAPLRSLGPIVLGVALVGCTEKEDDGTSGGSAGSGMEETGSSGTDETGSGSGETGTGESTDTETDTGNSATDTMESSGAEYGSVEDTGEDTTGGSKLDVGGSTATDTTESGGADYGGYADDPSDTRDRPLPRPR